MLFGSGNAFDCRRLSYSTISHEAYQKTDFFYLKKRSIDRVIFFSARECSRGGCVVDWECPCVSTDRVARVCVRELGHGGSSLCSVHAVEGRNSVCAWVHTIHSYLYSRQLCSKAMCWGIWNTIAVLSAVDVFVIGVFK